MLRPLEGPAGRAATWLWRRARYRGLNLPSSMAALCTVPPETQRAAPARTKVVITIDTECSEERFVRGKLWPPVGYEARIWGQFQNQERPLGIPLILDELEKCGLRGTFFVEALAYHHFGIAGLRAICEEIGNRGH